MARSQTRESRANFISRHGKGASPSKAIQAAARRCEGQGSSIKQIASCISNEIAIANGPARDKITDAQIDRVAAVIGKRRGLSGLRRRRRR